MAKEGTCTLGLTEDEKATHPIANPAALELLKRREDQRQQAAELRAERRRKTRELTEQTRLNSFPSAFLRPESLIQTQRPTGLIGVDKRQALNPLKVHKPVKIATWVLVTPNFYPFVS